MSEDKKYAVIRTGGQQFKVGIGSTIKVDAVDGSAGDSVTFQDVLVVSDGESVSIGDPLVAGAQVTGTVLGESRDPKVIAYKKKRRKGFHWKKGHRQTRVAVRIEGIS